CSASVVALRRNARTVNRLNDVALYSQIVEPAGHFVAHRAKDDSAVVLGVVAVPVDAVNIVDVQSRNHNVPCSAEVIEKDVDTPSNGTPWSMVGDFEVSNLHVLYVV